MSGDYSLDGASDVDRIRRTCGSVRNHCCQIVAGFGIGPALKATQPKVGQRLDPAVDDTVSEIRIEDTRSRSDRSCCGPQSRGTITLRLRDPKDKPIIDPPVPQ